MDHLAKIKKSWESYERYLVETRYAVRNPKTGEPLEHTYEDVIHRAVKELHKRQKIVEKNSTSPTDLKSLEKALLNRYVIPATPFLMSFGNPYTRRKGYFSCFPLGYVEDSMEEIRNTCEKMEAVYVRGGGCGIDVSKLRPRGSLVDNGQGVASGPVGFLAKFDAVTGTTNQGGRRRGALLIQMDWNHPDVEAFVKAKAAAAKVAAYLWTLPESERPEQNPILSNMNISVNAFGDFWKNEKLINLIAEQTWKTGDPGLLFVDNMKKWSPFKEEDNPRFSNPCGEYLAPANTACTLLTVNVAKIAYDCWDPKHETFNFQGFFNKVAYYADLACFLGNVLIDCDDGYPLEEIRKKTQEIRPVGVGMTGFHTALVLAYNGKQPYGSSEAKQFAEFTQLALTLGSLARSARLALKRGKAQYEWNPDYLKLHLEEIEETATKLESIYSGSTIPELATEVIKCGTLFGGFYNACTTSQPPTGSVSVFARVGGDTGIEPTFAIELKRRVRDFEKGWITVEVVTEPLAEALEIKPELRKLVETQLAHEISPDSQLETLGAFQKFVHTGVSKTINVPEETTIEDVKRLIQKAKDLRLKGFTVFRANSRMDAVYVTSERDEKNETASETNKTSRQSEELPPIRGAKVYEVRGPVNAYVTTAYDDEGKLREVFVSVGKAGTTLNSMFQAVGRLISVALRRHPDLAERFVETLEGIESGEFYTCDGLHGRSLPDMISKIMLDALGNERDNDSNSKNPSSVARQPINAKGGDLCPVCGNLSLVRKGGCKACTRCGHSTC